jgi:hypothetical protein
VNKRHHPTVQTEANCACAIYVIISKAKWWPTWLPDLPGWSGRAEAQPRPRVSKLRAKGLSNYHSSEIVVVAARQGASGSNKRATLTAYLLKKGELKSSSVFDRKREMVACQRKSTTDKKGRSPTLSSWCWCRREGWSWWQWGWVRTSRSDHKSMWHCFGVLRVKRQKEGWNRRPKAHTAGGVWFSPNT